MSWEDYTLKDLVTLKQGFALNKKSQHYLTGDNSGLPLLKISDLINGTETLFVKNNIPVQFLVTPSEIIYSRTGQVGLAFMGKTGVVYNNCFKVIPNEKLDSVFIFHWLNSKSIRDYIKSLATGAAQPDLNHDAFKSVKINLPPLPTQKRIASILSTYDDLIENNLKRIKLLEETAQNIYKEWFVNFRFPHYENTPFNEETGLPVGWEMKKIEDCINILKGKKPKNEYSNKGENRILYLLVDVLERKEMRFADNENIQLTYEGETLMLMDGSRSGLVFKSLEGAIGSTLAVFRIKTSDLGNNYCFNYFKFREAEIISKNTGSAIPHANKSYIIGMEIPIPTPSLKNEFELITSKIYKQIELIFTQNQKLKEARDILLPRLMNRTIEV